MAPPPNAVPLGSLPIRKIFDPWNSSATGHQRAENRLAGSASWRESRSLKLANQYGTGPEGEPRIPDPVRTGSRDGGMDVRRETGESGCHDIRELWRGEGRHRTGREKRSSEMVDGKHHDSTTMKERETVEAAPKPPPDRKKIFQGLRIYINGSTAPMVSDHRLKQLLAEHGGHISIALRRRSVTHVILGTPNGARGGVPGAGGGLAAGKIQKEIQRVGGCGVKYVGVAWVLESIKAGKRLPEARFANLSIAAQGQKSVYGMFQKPFHDPEAAVGTTGSNVLGENDGQLERRVGTLKR